jgi:hypothetical protein
MTTVLERPAVTHEPAVAPVVPAPVRQHTGRRYLAIGVLAGVVGIGVGFGLGYVSRSAEVAQLEATSVTTLAPLAQSQPHDVAARMDVAAAVPGLVQTLPHDVAARTGA